MLRRQEVHPKKHIMFILVITLTLAMVAGTGDLSYAAEDSSWQNDWTYTTQASADPQTITLTKYNGSETDYKIPSTAVIGGVEYKVILGGGGIRGSSIKNISFEEGVKINNGNSSASPFNNATNLETIDLRGADLSSATSMYYMFSGCSNVTEINMSGIKVPGVTDVRYMFRNCSALKKLDMSGVDLSGVSGSGNVRYMFYGATAIEELSFANADMSKVTSFAYSNPTNNFSPSPLHGMQALKKVDFSNFDTSSLTTAQRMFVIDGNNYDNKNRLEEIDVTGWKTPSVTQFYDTFMHCGENVDCVIKGLETMDISSATSLVGMFSTCIKVADLSGVESWDVSGVSDMTRMFQECESITSLDLSGWNTESLTSLSNTFAGCTSLTDINVSTWDTSKVSDMQQTFLGCTSLEKLDLSSWTSDGITRGYNMNEFLGKAGTTSSSDMGTAPLKEITLHKDFKFYTDTPVGLRGGYWNLKQGTDAQVAKRYSTARLYTQYNERKTPDFEDGYEYSHTWVLSVLDPAEANYYARGTGEENVWEVHYPDDKFKGYCINLHRAGPNGYYDRVIVKDNEIVDVGYIDSENYGWEPLGNNMEEAFITLIYYGWGNDADGIQAKYGLSDSQFMTLTQRLIWDFSDRYDTIEELPEDSDINKAYNELLSKRFADIPDNENLKLYLYESIDGRQNLLSISGLNNKAYAGVRVLKLVDKEDGAEPLKGAIFTVFDEDGANVATIVSDDDGYATKYNTDSIYGLPQGIYTIRETTPPRGYSRSGNDYYTFIVREEDDNTIITVGKLQGSGEDVGMIFTNVESTSVTGGGVAIEKKNDAGDPVIGATFEITDSSGTVAAELVTGQGGKASTGNKDLPLGTYTVKEISAPEGYIADTTPKTVTLTENKQVETVSFVNTTKKGSAKIEAKKEYNEALEGGEFSFRLLDDITGEVVAEAVNDKDGNIIFDMSYNGTEIGYKVYDLEEVKGDSDEITYDAHKEEIIVYISDDGSEELVTSVEYDDDGAVFKNHRERKEEETEKEEEPSSESESKDAPPPADDKKDPPERKGDIPASGDTADTGLYLAVMLTALLITIASSAARMKRKNR